MCLVAQPYLTLATPLTVACQALLSMARILEWVAVSSSRGFFPTQGSNPGLPLCRRILYHLSHQGSRREYLTSFAAKLFPGPKTDLRTCHS